MTTRETAQRLADALDVYCRSNPPTYIEQAASLLRQWPEAGWMPIESAPKDVKAHFWLAPRPPEKCFRDTSGNPMYFGGEPYAVFDFYGRWSVLYEAQCWHPGPAAPGAAPSRQPAPEVPSVDYPATIDALRAAVRNLEAQLAEKPEFETRADGKLVRIDRWEWGIRRIVALLWGNRKTFEVDEVVQAVSELAPYPQVDDESLVKAVESGYGAAQAAQSGMVRVPHDLLQRLIQEALTFDPTSQDKDAIEQAKRLAADPQAVPRRVRKIGGSFQHSGTVVAEFTTTAGEPRIVLEFDAPVAGMLHVYRPDQVEAALDAPQAVPQPLTPFGLTYKAHLQDAFKWLDSRRERLHHEGCSIHAPSAQCNCGLHKALTHIRAVINAVEDHTATKDAQIAKLKTVMIAAAEEIQSRWDAHCDAEGYGPVNLMRRLEEGIPSQYGYTAGRFAEMEAERDRLREALRKARFALRYHMEQTRPIEHTIDVLRAIEEALCD